MSRPLRILYHHRIRADDGQAVHVRELIGALRELGHEVRECALVPKTAPSTPGAEAGAGRGRLWQRLTLPRVGVELLEMLYNRRGRAMLRQAAGDFAPDFVYERHALHCRAGLDIARELGVPLLLEVNSPMVEEMRTLGKLRFPARARATERLVLAGADRVLAVSQVLAAQLQALGAPADRLLVVHNGAVPERYDDAAKAAAAAWRAEQRLPADAFVLGFVGYMRPWHRLELVLQVMALPALQRLHLLLVGHGPALPLLLQTAERLRLQGRVHAVGDVAPAQLPAMVLAGDAALVPAINAYASPLKLFDSLAAGVATLAPDQPNLRELIAPGDNGLLFTPGDASDLAAKLQALLADPGAAAALGARGRHSLLQHGWTWRDNAARVVMAFAAVRQVGAG